MTEETVVQRTGDRPLAFTGELVDFVSTKTDQGYGDGRWWELKLFRAESKPAAAGAPPPKRWVLQIAYKTRWQGELYLDSVIVADSDEELAAFAKDFDFMKAVRGYPHGQEAKQNELVKALTLLWETALTRILSNLGPERL